ncbi:MAG: FAD-dependent oxidoreductase [Burkholderiales bacterium]|nr:MAG: FAD-dependent oxidoreductase [Burkholderiales bacterium]
MKLDTTRVSRRALLKAAGAGSVLSALGACASPPIVSKSMGKVVVVGGGFSGATAAKYLRLWSGGAIEVVLIERNANFVSCPLSNLVLGGYRTIEQQTVSYEGLRSMGITLIQDQVTGIDAAKRTVALARGGTMGYDRLIVAPGIDFRYETISGYDAQVAETIPHSWKAGPQTVTLRRQLEAMPDGGVFVMTVPKGPYRCPPGPYERMCQVASYFKAAKPRSKVIVLDSNEKIVSKGALFTKVYTTEYKDIVEYRPNMNVTELDAATRTVTTELGDRVKADVLNVIPMQRAGDLARDAGLITVNNLWCGVDWLTLESAAHKNVHVIGDSTFSAPGMPKSGHMANQHGKAVAAAIVELMQGRAPVPPMMANTCYSFVDGKNVIHVASVHQYDAGQKTIVPIKGAGGLSPAPNQLEGKFAEAWANNIWADMLSAS